MVWLGGLFVYCFTHDTTCIALHQVDSVCTQLNLPVNKSCYCFNTKKIFFCVTLFYLFLTTIASHLPRLRGSLQNCSS
ncbi:hypothetical protein B0T25DRAFT_217724 [Lasiosphaeria hispida]|uniref:Uncharacterized protein n=1 Tax=Lasiosphaeria hispida TaxID=260671 RepID=A0AAJ0HJ05_9PEZI|nr:hypothetical protein B0T25DRAFT_217724 [Lasiosphaeria hispida]